MGDELRQLHPLGAPRLPGDLPGENGRGPRVEDGLLDAFDDGEGYTESGDMDQCECERAEE